MPTFKGDQEQIEADLRRVGLIRGEGTPVRLPTEMAPGRRKRSKVELVEAGHYEEDGAFVVVVPVHVVSEANAAGTFQAAIGRKGRNKDAVFRALAPLWRKLGPFGDRYRKGRELHVELCRLGGGRLDRTNLPRALKAVEDALASWLGCNDGSPLWAVSWGQEPGPKYGVRITLSENPL